MGQGSQESIQVAPFLEFSLYGWVILLIIERAFSLILLHGVIHLPLKIGENAKNSLILPHEVMQK
nr:MAG TPA: hypothetical protein [Caudoviricetes sp.]